MTWVWLLVTGVTVGCEHVVDSALDVEFLRAESTDEGGAELAEVIASAAATLEGYAPDTDAALWRVTARDGEQVPVGELAEAGLLVVDAADRLAFTIGRGRVVLMLGGDLVQVNRPDSKAYTAAYRLPGFTYWQTGKRQR